jgi:hypothetical protein
MEQEKKEAPKASSSQTDAKVAVTGDEAASIDFNGLKTVNNGGFTPDPWYKRLGWGLLDLLIQILLFLAGVILDVLKALVQVVVGFFKGIYKGSLAIGRFFRRWHRIFHEVDGYGKGSFFVQGLGQFHYGQRVDGIIFFSVEVLFILFMVFFGMADIINLVPRTITILDAQTHAPTETVTMLGPSWRDWFWSITVRIRSSCCCED